MVPICWATLHLLRLQTSIRERRIALCVWHTVWHSLSPALHDHSLSMNIIWRCWKLLFNQRWKARSGVTRLVSPGAATDGVTPIFPEKLTFLVIAVYKVYLFIPVVSLPIPPSTFRPRLSSVLSQFSHIFYFIRHPLEDVTRGDPPSPCDATRPAGFSVGHFFELPLRCVATEVSRNSDVWCDVLLTFLTSSPTMPFQTLFLSLLPYFLSLTGRISYEKPTCSAIILARSAQ